MKAGRRARPPKLRALQQWLAEIVMHPSTAEVAAAGAAARRLFAVADVAAGKVVKPNARMTPFQRLQVYNGSYAARLVEVLGNDFGALKHLLGREPFDALMTRYVAAHPSRHPNLNQFADHVPAFLARQRALPRRAFALELAQLELALEHAFDAPAFVPLAPERLQAVPPSKWDRAVLTLNPSVRLFAFRFPVNAWYQAWKEEKPIAPPAPARTCLAVYRKDYTIWRSTLRPEAFGVLTALAAGKALAPALLAAKGHADVGAWFRDWAADGLFAAVRVGR
jgi:hypothetical protein